MAGEGLQENKHLSQVLSKPTLIYKGNWFRSSIQNKFEEIAQDTDKKKPVS